MNAWRKRSDPAGGLCRLRDPGADRVHKVSLTELLRTAKVAFLCGTVPQTDMAQVGENGLEWFRMYLLYDHRMRNAAVFRDILRGLDPDETHGALLSRTEGAAEALQAAHMIAANGKTALGKSHRTSSVRF